jgi:hypothetical protein
MSDILTLAKIFWCAWSWSIFLRERNAYRDRKPVAGTADLVPSTSQPSRQAHLHENTTRKADSNNKQGPNQLGYQIK